MPKSKRARVVHTSVVQKKSSKEKSASLFSAVQAAAEQYQNVLVFTVDNMRNTYLKDVRQHFSDSRLFFGKTKVMAKALGLGAADEKAPGLGGLAKYLKGDVGLLFTDRNVQEVQDYFADFVQVDFARAGVPASRTFTVPAGVVYSTGGEQPVEDDVPLPHSMETQVRKWGMPTRLEKGRVLLEDDYVVCKEGKTMDSNQTALLKLFGVATAEFKIRTLAHWNAATEEVKEMATADGEAEDDESMSDA